MDKKLERAISLYVETAKKIGKITDIEPWCFRKTITDKTLNSTRLNEKKIRDAIKGTNYVEGDRPKFYFASDDSLKLVENWSNDHHTVRLYKKLHNNIKNTFEHVLDIKKFPNFSLKKNKLLLDKLNGLV